MTLTNEHRLFNNTRYSDARILIRDVIPPVHKSFICIQSEYFTKVFQESFAEGSSVERRFNDGSRAAYWKVLEYMYTSSYSDNTPSNFEGKVALTDNFHDVVIGTRQPPAAGRPSRIRPH